MLKCAKCMSNGMAQRAAELVKLNNNHEDQANYIARLGRGANEAFIVQRGESICLLHYIEEEQQRLRWIN